MDEIKTYQITLADGTEFIGTGDGAGNLICEGELNKDLFNRENLREVEIQEGEVSWTAEDQILRTFYYVNGNTFIRLDAMSEMELLKEKNAELEETNDMLTECILEMSEVVYGDE